MEGAQAAVTVILTLVALFALVQLVRLRRLRGKKEPPLPPVAVPPEEVELEEGPVSACMRCGSPNVRQARASELMIPGGGANLTWICGRCGHRGPALEFDSTTEFRAFVQGLNEDARDAPRER